MAYTGFSRVYDVLMQNVDYEYWAGYIDDLCTEMGLNGCRMVDCACGTAELTVLLKKRGYSIMGMDISDDMLNVALEKSRDAGVTIPFVRMDMKEFTLHKCADAVISTCDGVNYLTSLADVRAFFKSAYNALSFGGVLIFDVSTRYKLENIIGNNTFAEDCDDVAYIWNNEYNMKNKRVYMELSTFRLVEDKGLYERAFEIHTQRAHSEAELRNALKSQGFGDIAVYDAFTADAPSEKSERIHFVARKTNVGGVEKLNER